jgi:hypothetical protein
MTRAECSSCHLLPTKRRGWLGINEVKMRQAALILGETITK